MLWIRHTLYTFQARCDTLAYAGIRWHTLVYVLCMFKNCMRIPTYILYAKHSLGPIHTKDARFFCCGNSAADISKPHTFKWDPLLDLIPAQQPIKNQHKILWCGYQHVITSRPITALVFMRRPAFFCLGVNALVRTKRFLLAVGQGSSQA